MPQIGGKPKVSKTPKKKSSSSTKRNFTVVIGSKEHGLYVSSSPSSAARKAVSKLCASNKSKKVQFHIREITQKSDKKTYGPYLGYIEKLAKPIELKGRIIRYKPVAKLMKKTGKKSVVKKGGMRGGEGKVMVLKIEKPDNDFEKLEKDYSFNTVVLENINPSGNYMRMKFDRVDGDLKFFGVCTSDQQNQYDFKDNIVPETHTSNELGIRMLQFLLFKHGYNDASFHIFISINHSNRPYEAIEPNKEKIYYPLKKNELTNSERKNMDNT